MKTLSVILFMCLKCNSILGSQFGMVSDHVEKQEKTRLISQMLTNGTIEYVVILNIPMRIEARMAVTPERLEKNYYYKLEIRDIPSGKIIAALSKTMSEISLQKSEKHCDVRYAFLFHSNDGKKNAIYYDPRMKSGIIDGEKVDFGERLNVWIEEYCQKLFE